MMPRVEPLVSVLMTAYNREKYIAEAIKSVLSSTFINFELIIVDDASVDNTVAIAQTYAANDNRLKVYINEKNIGDYPNRNKAAGYATGTFITYVDSDDAIFSHSLQVMVNAANKYPDAALFMSVRSIDQSFAGFQYLAPKAAYEMHFKENGFMETGPLGVLINRVVFNKVGGFSGKRMIGDMELWLTIAKEYPIVRLEKDMVFWRQHAEQEFNDGFKYYLVDALQMYKEILVNTISPLGIAEGKACYGKIKNHKYYLLLRFLVKKRRVKESYHYFRAMQSVS